jgi:anaerobic magnesium-protoporphyrin IX monomethyl ester cyclase
VTHILFGQSYYLRFDPKLWDAGQPYPPLGTLYAASYLRARGYDVGLFDAMLAESEDEWAAALDHHQPRYAILFEDNFNYLSKMCLLRMRTAAFTMVRMAKARGCTVILCGADATDHAPKYFAEGADYVLLGEGEETLGELMDQLEGRTSGPMDLTGILGLAWPDGAGGQHRNPRRPDIRGLDALPFPAWDLVDIPRYQQVWRERHGYYSMNMVTTRGCPYHCNWCAKPIWGQRYNSRSPENVVAEMKWLKEQFQPDHIWFADDILGLKPGWLVRFSALLREAGASIPFKCLTRADLVTEAVAAALAEAGCETVWLGAESGSQKILDAMDKGDRVADIYTAAARLRAAGIRVCFFLQFGYPGETWDDIQATLKMVRECLPDDIGISVSYPLPGTRFYDRVRDQLGEKQNWIDSSDLALLYEGPFPQEFYRILHGRVHHEFRLRHALSGRARRAQGTGGRPKSGLGQRLTALARVPYHAAGMLRTEQRLRAIAARTQSAAKISAAAGR